MEEIVSKVALISVVIFALALVFTTFTRAQSQYQEAEMHVNSIAANASQKTLTVLYCFTNTTSNETMIHIYNYGESNYTAKLVIFYGDNVLFNNSVVFPSKEVRIISVNPPEGNPTEYELLLVWLESGDLEVVECTGS